MSKTKRHDMLALTISANVEHLRPEQYDKITTKLLKVAPIGCHVKEMGKEGNHPHMHYFFNFKNKPVVMKDFKIKIKNYCKKHLDLPGDYTTWDILIRVSPAYNPIGWVADYMNKEVPMTPWGEFQLAEYKEINEKYRVNKLGKEIKSITTKNFRYLYREYISQHEKKHKKTISFITKMESLLFHLYKNKYDPTPLIKNKKLYYTLMALEDDDHQYVRETCQAEYRKSVQMPN